MCILLHTCTLTSTILIEVIYVPENNEQNVAKIGVFALMLIVLSISLGYVGIFKQEKVKNVLGISTQLAQSGLGSPGDTTLPVNGDGGVVNTQPTQEPTKAPVDTIIQPTAAIATTAPQPTAAIVTTAPQPTVSQSFPTPTIAPIKIQPTPVPDLIFPDIIEPTQAPKQQVIAPNVVEQVLNDPTVDEVIVKTVDSNLVLQPVKYNDVTNEATYTNTEYVVSNTIQEAPTTTTVITTDQNSFRTTSTQEPEVVKEDRTILTQVKEIFTGSEDQVTQIDDLEDTLATELTPLETQKVRLIPKSQKLTSQYVAETQYNAWSVGDSVTALERSDVTTITESPVRVSMTGLTYALVDDNNTPIQINYYADYIWDILEANRYVSGAKPEKPVRLTIVNKEPQYTFKTEKTGYLLAFMPINYCKKIIVSAMTQDVLLDKGCSSLDELWSTITLSF